MDQNSISERGPDEAERETTVADPEASNSDSAHVRRPRSRSQTFTRYIPSRKRKAGDPERRITKWRRVQGSYSTAYGDLWATTRKDIETGDVIDSESSLEQSQLGLCLWSGPEKTKFFHALTKYGRDDLPAIASSVGTKSEIEVRHYLQLLEKCLLEKHLYESRTKLVGLTAMPAAVEIDEATEVLLDQAAEALRLYEDKETERVEPDQYSHLWRLDQEAAMYLEGLRDSGEKGEKEAFQLCPPIELLNLPKWTRLSEGLFMNSGPPKESDNWRELAFKGETPSILHSAFSDFHALAIHLTKIIVQSSLYYATSRLRSNDGTIAHKDEVIPVDIYNAAESLNLPARSPRFWAELPRRNCLKVVDRRNLRGWIDRELASDEVEEQILQNPWATNRSQSRKEDDMHTRDAEDDTPDTDEVTFAKSGDDHQTSSSSVTESEESPLDEGDSSAPSQMSETDLADLGYYEPSSRRAVKRQVELEKRQEEYAEALDQQAGKQEMLRLWTLLGHEPPQAYQDPVNLPDEPEIRRKAEGEAIDWRQKVQYHGEWERSTGLVPEEAFKQVPRSTQRFNNYSNPQRMGDGFGLDGAGDASSDRRSESYATSSESHDPIAYTVPVAQSPEIEEVTQRDNDGADRSAPLTQQNVEALERDSEKSAHSGSGTEEEDDRTESEEDRESEDMIGSLILEGTTPSDSHSLSPGFDPDASIESWYSGAEHPSQSRTPSPGSSSSLRLRGKENEITESEDGNEDKH